MGTVGAILLIAVGSVGLFVVQRWLEGRDAAARRALQATGHPVVSVLVMANAEFLTTHDPDAQGPALVAFCFDEPTPALREELLSVAGRAFELYASKEPLGRLHGVQRAVASMVRDDGYRPGRRDKLPGQFTGGREVFLAHILLTRRELRRELAVTRVLPCAVSGREKGEIVPLDPHDPRGDLLLGKVGL